jgi:hypothetical protein
MGASTLMTDAQGLQLFFIVTASLIAADAFNRFIGGLIMRQQMTKLFQTIDIRKFEKDDRE